MDVMVVILGLLREAINEEKKKYEWKIPFQAGDQDTEWKFPFIFYFDGFPKGKVKNVCISWDSRRREEVQEVEKTAL